MKIISCVLVASLSFSIGCYNHDTITREQLNPTTKEELRAEVEQLNITVFTKDSGEYKFLKGNYRVHGDTLIGFGVQTIGGDDRPFHGFVTFADITSLQTQEFSLAKTLITIGLPVGAVVAFFLSWSAGASKH